MTIEELQKQFETLTGSVDVMKKEFTVKIDAANKNAEEWKKVAESSAAEVKKLQEEAKKAEEGRVKALSEARKAEVKAFIEAAKKDGRITPAQEELIVKLAESLTSENVVATFEDKDGKKIQHTQISLFKEILGALPKAGRMRQLTPSGTGAPAAPGEGEGAAETATMFVDGKRQTVILDDTALDAETKKVIAEYRERKENISYGEAMIIAEKRLRPLEV